MKMNKFLIALVVGLMSISGFAQTTQFRYRVKIPESFVYKNPDETKYVQIVKKEDKTVVLQKGTVVSNEGEYKQGDVKYKYVYHDTLDAQRSVVIKESKPENFDKAKGFATLKVDEKDKSKIYINYWRRDGDPNFDSNADYYIKLKNRQTARFWFNTWEIGALTVPFKYRPSFTRNGVKVEEQFNADLNVGLYTGFTFGQVFYSYRKREDTKPTEWKISVGPFLSVSTLKIDANNTTSADVPLTDERTIATLSPGLGLMASIRDFRFGFFVGADYAFGDTAKKWNYNKKTWYGFGLGYNLGLIWGKAE